MQVKVDAFPRPKAKTASSKAGITFVAAGLLIWEDEKNFVRLFRAANGDRGNLFGTLEVFRDGKFVGDGFTSILKDEATHLKVSRKDNAFTFAVSADGKAWTEVKGNSADLNAIELPKKLKVGVAATNAAKIEFSPVFEDFSLKAK